MVLGFITTYAISVYHHLRCELESRSGELGALDTTLCDKVGQWVDTTLCDKVCQWVGTGRWFSPGTPVSSTNKTDRNDMTVILLKVALDTINLAILLP